MKLSELPVHASYKLGLPRLLRTDTRTLMLSRYVKSSMPKPPSVSAWIENVTKSGKPWGMLGNDTLGDCVEAAAGHHEMIWTAASGGPSKIFLPTAAQIVGDYSAITGYTPSNQSSDQGTDPLDALNYYRQKGIAGRPPLAAYVGLTAQLGSVDETQVMDSVYLFGGCYVALSLPLSAQQQTGLWTVPSGGTATQNGSPGGWGGHMVPIVGYNSRQVGFITWGMLWYMTWDFLNTYCSNAYALLSSDWLNSHQAALNGLDMAALQDDLDAITSV